MTLIQYRAENDLTQAEAAALFKVHERSIRRYEAGEMPRAYIAERMRLISNGAVTFERQKEAAE